MVVGVLLPGMALMPAHAPLSLELWSLLRSFPYDIRFRFYNSVQARATPHPPYAVQWPTHVMARWRAAVLRSVFGSCGGSM